MNHLNLRRACALLLAFLMMFGLCACGRKVISAAQTPAPASAPPAGQGTGDGAAEPAPESTPEPTPDPTPEPTPEPIVGELLTDDDGDGIIHYKFHYKGATVYAMIVLDPSRVFVGTALPEPSEWGGYGITLDEMAVQYDAIAGINAGGFLDQNGGGNGWPPSGITYSRGTCFATLQNGPVAGLDRDNHMWTSFFESDECDTIGIRDAVSFGPVLAYADGIKADSSNFESGIGARTAIGQREDGSIVMVAIDGRQGYSIGVTYADCADIMFDKFQCINASNMDGGNSTAMYFDGQAVNRSSNQAGGTRTLPDAWLVSRLPAGYVRPAGVPERIVLPENALGEIRDYVSECDPETSQRLFDFAVKFAGAYYGYFGTQNADYYYPTLLQYVQEGSELQERMLLALGDRMWVNTYYTPAENIRLDGAYLNPDGSFDILITSDIFEQATYWSYSAPDTPLRITVVEAPGSLTGYLAVATN